MFSLSGTSSGSTTDPNPNPKILKKVVFFEPISKEVANVTIPHNDSRRTPEFVPLSPFSFPSCGPEKKKRT